MSNFHMIKAAALAVFISWIPIENTNLKIQIGVLLSALIESDLLWQIFLYLQLCKKKQITIPDRTRENDFNPLFDKVQDYLSVKFAKSIESCELIPKNGNVEYNLKNITNKIFIDEYLTHTLQLKIENDSSSQTKTPIRQICITSETASADDVRNYVRKITSIQLKNTNVIKIYRPIMRGKKKDERTVEWEHIIARTNKTLENTIYSESFQKEMFDDLETFMNSEEQYAKKGIPYKRGYFLYSAPGQGKTSVAKIIANRYGTPIFCLDLTTIDDNATLIKLMTELNYYTHHNKYILLIEDAERCDFFKPHTYREPKLSMDCFLNVIDGVVEPHGRIIIMSANDPTEILRNKALMRAGRIDKTIELLPCNKYQIKRMYELFFGSADDICSTDNIINVGNIHAADDIINVNSIRDAENNIPADCVSGIDCAANPCPVSNRSNANKYIVNWDNWEFNETLSAAYIMKLLQENQNKPDVFMHMVGEAKTGDDKDIQLDDTFKHAVTLAKTEQTLLTNDLNNNENRFRRGRSRNRRRGPKSRSAKDVLKFTNVSIIKNKKKADIFLSKNTKLEQKIPVLLEKLKTSEAKEAVKKLKAKAKKRAAYLLLSKKTSKSTNKDSTDVNNSANTIDVNNSVNDPPDEEEYETPAFLMNSIDVNEVPVNTITTYETIEPLDVEYTLNALEAEFKYEAKSEPSELDKNIFIPVRKNKKQMVHDSVNDLLVNDQQLDSANDPSHVNDLVNDPSHAKDLVNDPSHAKDLVNDPSHVLFGLRRRVK